MYIDIYGFETDNVSTIQATMSVSELKPDNVIVNNTIKTLKVLEITVPCAGNIKKGIIYKSMQTLQNISPHKKTTITFDLYAGAT